MEQIISQVVKQLFDQDISVQLTRPDPKFGDFATNVALQLAKPLGKNPREIAEMIAENLRKEEEFSEVSVAGPGFINVKLSDQSVLNSLKKEPITKRAGQTVVIETNCPNPFKAMHIGHALNAILADTMANLLAVDGAIVHRVSYHGDVGTHVGKSMWAILREIDGDVNKLNEIPADKRNEFMSRMYVEGARAAKESPEAKAEIDELAKQSFVLDDPLYKQVYEICKSWSFDEIDSNVGRLGNVPIERRYVESETEELGKSLIKEKTPEVFTKSDGAYVFKGSKYGAFDNVFIGSHGNGLYGAHDMGLIQLKYKDYPDLDLSITVNAEEQAAYFRGVIAASELSIPALKGKLFNYATGFVKLATGKMSSRTGEVVTIGWLFDEFKKAIENAGGEPTDDVIAGALRYQFLKVKIGGDVIFDINDAVSLTGNTGSYLQYAHARARGILTKSDKEIAFPTELFDEDKMLVRKLSEYVNMVDRAKESLEPHHICTYLFELAQEFNRYYEKNQVIGSDKEAHRVGIVAIYADILKAGLAILGIVAPDRL
ncbi:arginine--tRNA ligase [Candidatus Nanosynbacter sp. TM7-057]|uniref:arginine--tRNA ligase n=1 Tax=Candidatus Nanosynbacter sp. TM7-057 TaxID=2902630 RepID=UPI001FB82E48|nr:arginine--tRNA ligase [Candidatus Nanosynbacter sp. TM7-057]MCJ1964719.1 arginine--tRNA ligase [Candidatus Nanosynbacter sp. TM7-057]